MAGGEDDPWKTGQGEAEVGGGEDTAPPGQGTVV